MLKYSALNLKLATGLHMRASYLARLASKTEGIFLPTFSFSIACWPKSAVKLHFYAPINGLPQYGEGEGATPGKLTFKLAPWKGILTVKYLLICINCKGLYGNSTSGEHSGEGNLRFSSQKSQILRRLPPHPGANH